ncbi:spinster family MFS transporter [Sphingomonas sp. DT-207]|uniref:spinster family MFS transporter n=1 Tax=Sphingomonas sp. DT-207 TaxID=3396167 RepID=UPI003F1AE01A
MTQAAAPVPVSRAYRGLVLAMLLLVYTFNFLDRQILGILVQPIKADLGLTDTQLGALGGVAFALLYSTLGIPFALLADRTSRSWVITAALTVWSGFTALCGLATGFWQLFFFRLGVGVGEAGGVAPSYAMIADYFPPEKRARALAIYSLGIPIGLAGGALLGGYIAATVDWRAAFVVVGLAGIVIAPIFRLVVREPVRGGSDSESVRAAAAERVPVSSVFPILARKPSFWLLAFAAAFSSMCGYGLAFWVPSVLIRSFGFTLMEASQFMGSLLLIGGTAGVFAGGWFADRLGRGDRAIYARMPAFAWLATAPLFAAGLMSPSPVLAWFLLLIPNGLNILWLGPITTAVQHLVQPRMRATASASFLFINNLIGLGAGSWVMGWMSDTLKASQGADALRYSAILALSFYVVAGVLGLLAAKHLRKDWADPVDA